MKLSYDFIDKLEDVLFICNKQKQVVRINYAAKHFLSRLFYDEEWTQSLTVPEFTFPLIDISTELEDIAEGTMNIHIRKLDFTIYIEKILIGGEDCFLLVFKDDVSTSLELAHLTEAFYDSIAITTGDGIIEKSNLNSSISTVNPMGLDMVKLQDEGHVKNSISLKVAAQKRPSRTFVNYQDGKIISWIGKPFFDDTGKLVRIISVGKDITKVVNLNKQIQNERKLEWEYMEQVQYLKNNFDSHGIVYSSDAMRDVLSTIIKIASTDSSVILTGESGVGKDLIARTIHEISNRKNQPFTPINCSAIPESLIESELFGYESGAFTGASGEGKIGIFESANHGTLFLDEVGELPIAMQGKLLRVLQEEAVMRVGGNKPIPIDVRIISATNLSRERLSDWRYFRQDLFYRLSVIDIEIPPLRNRREDIIPLATHFLSECNKKYKKNLIFSHAAIDTLYNYSWPGNVRELKNVIEVEVLLTEGTKIDIKTISEKGRSSVNETSDSSVQVDHLMPMKEAYNRLENILINLAVQETGSIIGAAKKLEIAPSTIHRKIKNGQLNIHKR